MRLVTSIPLFALLLAGCGAATTEQLARRAAFDLKCERSKLEYVVLDDQTVGVVGCGKRATYVEACRTKAIRQCTWIMNNDSAPE